MKKWVEKQAVWLSAVPVLLIMAVIFGFSAQNGAQSGGLSGKIALFLTRLVQPDAVAATEQLEHFVRKCAHFTEYATLGFFMLLHFQQIGKRVSFRKQWLWAWVAGTAYAAVDELHQMFVPDRGPSVLDVGLDSVGVAVGVALLVLLCYRRRK